MAPTLSRVLQPQPPTGIDHDHVTCIRFLLSENLPDDNPKAAVGNILAERLSLVPMIPSQGYPTVYLGEVSMIGGQRDTIVYLV